MIFGTDIAGMITDAFEGQLLPAELVREVTGEYDPIDDRYEDEEGNPVEPGTQIYTSEGVIEAYSDEMIASGFATAKDRKIMVLAQPLGTVPKLGDKITIDGETLTVTGIPQKDPATATWTIRGEL